MDNVMGNYWLLLLVIPGMALSWLIFQKRFWLVAFGVGGLAAAFTTLACIFHFQILGALGAFFLTGICWFIAMIIHNRVD
jgi:hypothetical protein